MTCGIYKITNKLNGKVYIGQSCDIEERWKRHKSTKRLGHLYSAFKKYGIDNFTFSIICECPESALGEYEISYIKYYETTNNTKGYNKTFGGEGGRKTEETKIKMSAAQKNKPKISEITRKNMSNASKGRVQTEESRRKHSTSIILDGVEYYSKKEAARQLGIASSTLLYRLRNV